MPQLSTNVSHAVADERWSVIRLQHEVLRTLLWEFTVPDGNGSSTAVVLPAELSVSQIARKLRGYTSRLPEKRAAAEAFVNNLMKLVGPRFVQTNTTGWKPAELQNLDTAILVNGRSAADAFVMPGRIIPLGEIGYRWAKPPHGPGIGHAKGNLKSWQSLYSKFAEQSNFICFSQMTALAAPICRFVDLPESPVFNYFGDSSTGKTTAVKSGATVFGAPDTASWDQTARALEETAAAHNDILLILNAAERSKAIDRQTILSRITHMVTEGSSTSRSAGVQDIYPNLAWKGVTLSTSNLSGRAMAAQLKMCWEEQEEARFIDIPVPTQRAGGIFDRLTDKRDPEKTAAALVQELAEIMKHIHGAPFEPWINYLHDCNPGPRLRELIERFLGRVGSPSGLEGRIARKFALVYAAGRMANKDADLLGWKKDRPLQAALAMYRRALEFRTASKAGQAGVITEFGKLLADPKLVRRVERGVTLKFAADHDLLGVWYSLNGRDVLGLRQNSLRHHLGDGTRQVMSWIEQHDLAVAGHGDRRGQQLPIMITVGNKSHDRPRFLLLDGSALQDALRAIP